MKNAVRLRLLPVLLSGLAATAGSAEAAPAAMDFTAEPAPRSSLAPDGGYFRISAFNSRENVEEVSRRLTSFTW